MIHTSDLLTAEARSYGLNKMSLDEIESAMFVLALDDRAPETWSATGQLSLHGGYMYKYVCACACVHMFSSIPPVVAAR